MKKLLIILLLLSIHTCAFARADNPESSRPKNDRDENYALNFSFEKSDVAGKDTRDRARTRAIETRSSYSSTAGGRFSPGVFACRQPSSSNYCERVVLATALQSRVRSAAAVSKGRGDPKVKRPPKERRPSNPPPVKRRRPPTKPPVGGPKEHEPRGGQQEADHTFGDFLPDHGDDPPGHPIRPGPPIVIVECYVETGYYGESEWDLDEAGIWISSISIIASSLSLSAGGDSNGIATFGITAGSMGLLFSSSKEARHRKINFVTGAAALVLGLLNTK